MFSDMLSNAFCDDNKTGINSVLGQMTDSSTCGGYWRRQWTTQCITSGSQTTVVQCLHRGPHTTEHEQLSNWLQQFGPRILQKLCMDKAISIERETLKIVTKFTLFSSTFNRFVNIVCHQDWFGSRITIMAVRCIQQVTDFIIQQQILI